MNSKEFSIPRESELRVEIFDGETCVINLVGGSIEIFGLEVGGKDNFTLDWPCQIAFFSWDGATNPNPNPARPEPVRPSTSSPIPIPIPIPKA